MNEDTIVRYSASGRTIILVSEEVKFIRIFAGDNRLTLYGQIVIVEMK